MSQPTVTNMTFDTSLVEVPPEPSQYGYPAIVNTSFSTTDSAPSETAEPTSSTAFSHGSALSPTPTLSLPPKTGTPVQHIATQDAYDQWASIYDSDGNMLQSVDDSELTSFLPNFLHIVLSTRHSPTSSICLIDLGCGTGRNTVKLVSYSWPNMNQPINIIGLDFSQGMLEVAATKLSALSKNAGVNWTAQQCDCFPTVSNKKTSPMPNVPSLSAVDAVISTLVLEHIPLRDYFSTLASITVKDGYALVTNMHSEMGKLSQAGFVNKEGVKVRAGQSYAHTLEEAVEEARKAGFKVVEVRERGVQESDLKRGVVGQRGKKWVGVNVWYGLMLKKIV